MFLREPAFPLYLPWSFSSWRWLSLITCASDQAASHISAFLSLGVRVRIESTRQSGTPGDKLGLKRPFSGPNRDSGKERDTSFSGVSWGMNTLSCCWPPSPLCGASIPCNDGDPGQTEPTRGETQSEPDDVTQSPESTRIWSRTHLTSWFQITRAKFAIILLFFTLVSLGGVSVSCTTRALIQTVWKSLTGYYWWSLNNTAINRAESSVIRF